MFLGQCDCEWAIYDAVYSIDYARDVLDARISELVQAADACQFMATVCGLGLALLVGFAIWALVLRAKGVHHVW